MTSSIVECEALVLRNLRYGDTSRIAVLFTRSLGKIAAIGKGVRDPKSPFGASLEILTHSSFVLYHRPGRDLQFLKSGWIEREFRGILRESERYLFACACAEFLDRMLPDEEPAEELLDLALRAMEVMEGARVESLPELFRAWQLRASALLGYAPRTEACLACGRPAPGTPSGGPVHEGASDESAAWTFRPAEGGVLCPACSSAEGGAPGIRLTPRALRRVRAMITARGSVGLRGEAALGGYSGGRVHERPGPTPEAPIRVGAERLLASEDSTSPTALSPAARAAWARTLDRIVEEFLRYHVDAYRGLRSLETRRHT